MNINTTHAKSIKIRIIINEMNGKNSNNTRNELPSPATAAEGEAAEPRTARPYTPPAERDLRDIMGDAREIVLLHNGERYRLRITANGKLILTK
ncbi:hemin uptake protein HemP [Pseudochelatococcus sp. B33]